MKTLILTLAIAVSALSANAQGWRHGGYYGHPRYYAPRVYAHPRVIVEPVRPRFYHPYYPVLAVAPRVFLPPVPVLSVNVNPAPRVITQPVVENNYYETPPAPSAPANTNVNVYPLDANSFANAKNSIASKTTESARLTVAKQMVDANYVSASQVRELMTLFALESSRLDFAKYAYNHTTDKNNYFTVNDAFTMEASIYDLDNYINGR